MPHDGRTLMKQIVNYKLSDSGKIRLSMSFRLPYRSGVLCYRTSAALCTRVSWAQGQGRGGVLASVGTARRKDSSMQCLCPPFLSGPQKSRSVGSRGWMLKAELDILLDISL